MFFKQIIGQNSLKQKITQAFTSNKLGHATMFTGIEGYGTLAFALSLSRFIMCTNRNENDACGECKSCKKFDRWVHPDLHFVFPVINKKPKEPISDSYIAEWRKFITKNCYGSYEEWIKTISSDNKQGGIFKDESDAIAKKLNLKSFESNCKIMIIWLPEKMNDTASNKILKILEEPPPLTYFFLVSAQPEQLLQTILSRTQTVSVPPLSLSEITEQLIITKHISEEKAYEIAIYAEGDYGKALELVERSDDLLLNAEKYNTYINYSLNEKFVELLNFIESNLSKDKTAQIEFLQHILFEMRKMTAQNIKQSQNGQYNSEVTQSQSPYSLIQIRNIYKLTNIAIMHIERNVNSKIVFTDLALQFRKIIKM